MEVKYPLFLACMLYMYALSLQTSPVHGRLPYGPPFWLLITFRLQPCWRHAAAPCCRPCSEKKLRRLEIANPNPKLARLQLYRLLSHSESRWVTEMSSAGLNADGQPKTGGCGLGECWCCK
jgi:hypothetical protein